MTKRLLLVSLSVAWVAALLCVTQVLALANCDPDCSGKDLGDKVADPLNCTRYYICMQDEKPSQAPLPCPAGYFFDEWAKPPDCAYSTAHCDPTCTLPDCHLTCYGKLDKISDPTSCSSYYVCQDSGVVGPVECPPDEPYFDGTACGVDDTKCCGDLCIPYCYPEVVEVPDPYDCTKFYLCPKWGLADEQYHNSCPSGANFDIAMGECVVGAPCNTLCDEITSSNTPTTSPNTPTTSPQTPSSTTPTTSPNTPTPSTTTPTTRKTTPTTTSPNCRESMVCTSVGYFPKCTTCDQQYFQCLYVGLTATVGYCEGNLVFNTDPDYAYCIPPSNCPFHP